jgi:hypothetical protein
VRRLAWLAAALAATPAAAETLPAGPDLAALGWEVFTFSGRAPDRFIGHDDGTIEVVSRNSISALYLPVEADLALTPCLSWRWRVDEAPPVTDLRRHGGDDRALAVFVSFPYEPGQAGFWEGLVRPVVELIYGKDAPGRVLSYVWGGKGRPGEVRKSAYLGAAGALVLLRPKAQPAGRWLDETVDVAADYRRVFDDAPLRPRQVAILSDTDDTRSRAHAYVADLRFHDCGGHAADAE